MSVASKPEHQPPLWQRIGAAWGFHVPMLAFALRTAMAAFLALLVAHVMGLEHPHWAAMSAWASSQPLREHLFARGMYRFGGSIIGVMYAVALVLVAQDSIWVLALGLAFWGALCAFVGNLQRGYMVYGCMLAGYSAAMVVLLHHGPADTVWPFAWDRMWTVIVGVAAALCISWCFSPRRKSAVLIAQSRQALAGVLEACSVYCKQQPVLQNAAGGVDVLSRLAEVEELLELYPEGSRMARRTSKAMHWQQHQALEVVFQLAHSRRMATSEAAQVDPALLTQLAQSLDTLVHALLAAPAELGSASTPLQQGLQDAIGACEALVAAVQLAGQPVPALWQSLYALLKEMQRGLAVEEHDLHGAAVQPDLREDPLPLHRDWVGAREAGIRAGVTLLLFGVAWAWTGASIVGFGMLGLTVMLLVFSAFESPSRTMAFVLRGQIVGAVLALLCQTLVWPWAHSSWEMVWMLLPFAIVGGLVFAHKRTAAGAMDTNMVMFILLAPKYPDTLGFAQHASYALAVVSGPALAWLVYRLLYPTDAVRRMKTLARMMLDEVPALARRMVDDGVPGKWSLTVAAPEGQWQAQLHHRLLRLVRWADKTCWSQRSQLPAMGMALRTMQSTLLQLQQWRREMVPATAALRRAERLAEIALLRTAQWGGAPEQAERLAPKVEAAWQALAQQTVLPPVLMQRVQQIAQRDFRVLDATRHALTVA